MYHDGGTLADVEQAIRYAQDAAGVEAQEASQVVNVTGLLGLCYTTKYKVTQCEDDLLKAIEADESDLWVFMPVANISDILVLAQRLMESYKTLENWEKGLKIAEYALELVPAYITRYLDGRKLNPFFRQLAVLHISPQPFRFKPRNLRLSLWHY
ncbi:hypothetical protein FVER14953_00111 [Fusarium verticillioides]|nr:hypothetical protein FVER14953_00111 [Fusarium verticillioides]